MDFLQNNFIANMYGPTFLVLYFIIVVVVCGGIYISKSILDDTNRRDAPRIPKTIDPYEVAYLRGGSSELIKVILFSLVSRGYLKVSDGLQYVVRELNCPPHENLVPVEEEVLRFVGDRMTVKSLMNYSVLDANIEKLAASFEYIKEEKGLIASAEVKAKFQKIKNIGISIIIAFGSYKFIIALMKGKTNFVLLILFGVIGSMVIASSTFPSLTRKGRAFLENLQTAFNKSSLNNLESLNLYNQMAVAAIFGFGFMTIPEFEFIRNYERSLESTGSYSSGGGGGCSSGCGSSCGGGCGGGCGGCS